MTSSVQIHPPIKPLWGHYISWKEPVVLAEGMEDNDANIAARK
jgi:hypothetical protein